MKKIVVTLVISIVSTLCFAQQSDKLNEITQQNWKAIDTKIATPSAIFEHHKQLKAKLKKEYKNDKTMLNSVSTYNDYQLILMLAEKAKTMTPKELSKLITLDLDNPLIGDYVAKKTVFLSDYYTLLSMKEGNSYEDSKTGMLFNTSYGGILKEVDYRNMKDVLSSKNEILKNDYLNMILSAIRFNGLTYKLLDLLPLIEKNTVEGDLKKSVLKMYSDYMHLLPNKVAPIFTLKDYKGKEYSLSDYKGKVVVIDVWATWCGGCIEKLPYFLKVRDKYKGREDIVFMVISTDNKGAYTKWKFAHPKYNLMDIISLVVCENENTFAKDYNVTGIPRYLVIDKQGKIVNVYAPSPYPGDEFIQIIEDTLNK